MVGPVLNGESDRTPFADLLLRHPASACDCDGVVRSRQRHLSRDFLEVALVPLNPWTLGIPKRLSVGTHLVHA